MGCRVFLSLLYWHSSTPLIIIIEAVCFYCCSFSFFFFSNLITRWLGYLLKTEMMMIFFDAKKSKTRGYTASSILPSLSAIYFLFFLLKENLSTFLQSQTTGYTVASPFLLYEEVIEQHTLRHRRKKTVFFFFFFLSFVE